jgi:sigma-B regulation protein RsbU (phosphoserine phosphatase)
MNPEEEEFGEDRFRAFVDAQVGVNPENFHQEFLKLMGEFSREIPLRDDLTLLSLRFS